jgi:hypothetical protein
MEQGIFRICRKIDLKIIVADKERRWKNIRKTEFTWAWDYPWSKKCIILRRGKMLKKEL